MRVRIRVDENNPRAEEKDTSRFSDRRIASDDLVLDLSHVWRRSGETKADHTGSRCHRDRQPYPAGNLIFS